MNNKIRFSVIIFALLLLRPVRLQGFGFLLPNQDAEAMARGNAFVATANNPSAIYYNPAGITQIEDQNLQFSLYSITVKSEYRSLSGHISDTDGDLQSVPSFFYVVSPKNKPFSFGLGMYAPYGLALEWPEDSGFRTIITEAKLQYLTINPVVALQVSRTFSIAAGPTINYAKASLEQGILVPSSLYNNSQNALLGLPPNDEFEIEGDDFAYGFNVGLLWQPIRELSFGATYRSGTTMNFRGNSEANPYTPSEITTLGFDFPQQAVVGVSYRPTPSWNFEFNAHWSDWDTLNSVTIQKNSGDAVLPLNWKASWMYEFGASYYFQNGFALSAGYIFSENSIPDANYFPAVPDTDLHFMNFGISYRRKNWLYALAYQYVTGPWNKVRNSQSTSLVGETADGDYKYDNHAFSVSIGYHF